LHSKGEKNVASTMSSVGDTCTWSVMSYHRSSTGHWILSADAEAVNEQTDNVHCNPSSQSPPPHCSQKNCGEKH
jgi:hypothetical protein